MEFLEDQLLATRDQHEAWLNQQPGISGTGVGLNSGGQVCIKIFTNHMPPDIKTAISQRLGTVPIDFEETGEFRAF